MITKNEEKYLQQCLSSVKDFVDEIIVVDTGSTDKTKEIAKKFSANVFDFKWVDDFSAARNESLKRATKDWILVLDADEKLAKKDLEKLKELTIDENYVAYYFVIRTYTDESSAAGWSSSKEDDYEESRCASGWFATKMVRMFKNRSNIYFDGVIHETVRDSIEDAGKIKESDFPIHHFGRLTNEKSSFKKELYQKLTKLKMSAKEDFHSYSQLAIQAQETGNFEKAIEYFKKSIELNSQYFKSWFNLGACYLKLSRLNDAEEALTRAIKLNPDDFSTHNNLAITYSQLNRPMDAINEFGLALKLNPNNANAYFNFGILLDEIGKKDAAYRAFKKAIELNPKYQEKIKLK